MVRPSGDHRRCRAPRTRPPKLGVHAIEVGPSGITACTRCWVRRLDRLQSWPAPQTALTHTAGGASTRTGTPPAVDWVTNFARPCRAERLFSAHGGAMLASEVARAGKPRGTRWPRTGHDLGALRSPKVLGERSSGRWWVRWNYRSSVDGEVVHWGNGELRRDLPKPWSGCAPPGNQMVLQHLVEKGCRFPQLPRHLAGPGSPGYHPQVRPWPGVASSSRLSVEAIQPKGHSASQNRQQAEVGGLAPPTKPKGGRREDHGQRRPGGVEAPN